MKYSIQLDKITVSADDRQLINNKIDRLATIITDPYVIDLKFARDTHHAKGEVVTCIINVEQGKRVFHAERKSETVQTSLDLTLGALSQELAHYHKKIGRVIHNK